MIKKTSRQVPAQGKRAASAAVQGGVWFLSSWRPYLIIAMAILAVYFQTIGFSFTNMDDTQLVVNSYGFNRDPGNFRRAFSENVFRESRGMIYYRPLLTVSLMLDAMAGGTKPAVYHSSNVIIHLLACLLLFWMLQAFGLNPGFGLAGTLFFAVHPALTQAVAWIPGRNDSLLGLFVFASFGSFMKYCRQGQWRWLVLMAVSFAAALFTKETAVLLPVLGLAFLAMERPVMLRFRRLGLLMAAWAFPLAVWLLLRSEVSSQLIQANVLYNSTGNIAAGIISYIGKSILPVDLSILRDLRDIKPVYGLFSILLLVLAAAAGLENGRRFLFGVLWFLIFLVPTMLFSTSDNAFLDHRLYLPLAGMVLMMGQLKLFHRFRGAWSRLAAIFWLAAFAGGTLFYSRSFRDDIACWSSAVRKSPRSASARNYLGFSYSSNGRKGDAKREYLAALRLAPDFYWSLYNLGSIYLVQDSLDQAEKYLNRTLDLSPGFPEAAYNLGKVYERRGLAEEACWYYLKELKSNPGYAGAYVSLAALYQEQGKIQKARDHYQKALQLAPDNTDAYTNLGVISQQQGDWSGAEQNYRKALKIDPEKVQARFNLGVLYQSRGMLEMARAEYDHVIRLNPALRSRVKKQLLGK